MGDDRRDDAHAPRSGDMGTASLAAACGDRDQRRRTASVCGELMLLRRFFPCGAAAGSELINQSAGCNCSGNGHCRVQDYGDVPTLAARMREPGL